MSELDWRELKKELLMSPLRTRTSKTFQHSDVFNAKDNSKPQSTIVKGVANEPRFLTPSRIRENDTTKSQVLDKSATKSEAPTKLPGKRCFEVKSTIFKDVTPKKPKVNPHRIPDHKDEWFYEQTNDPRRPLTAHKLSSSSKTPQKQQVESSPHRQKKQEELYKSEIGTKHYLSPDGNNLNLVPRSRSEMNLQLSRTLSEYRPSDRKNEEYQSHIFEAAGYSFDYNQQYNTEQVPEDKPLDNPEANRIKRLNHNFSNVFGLEYGAKESVHNKKQEGRDLPSQLVWTNVDSILNKKDVGQKHKAKTLQKQRSRIMDQKSTLDTHSAYDNASTKIVRQSNIKNPVIQRGSHKNGK